MVQFILCRGGRYCSLFASGVGVVHTTNEYMALGSTIRSNSPINQVGNHKMYSETSFASLVLVIGKVPKIDSRY